jgi:uridine kinase
MGNIKLNVEGKNITVQKNTTLETVSLDFITKERPLLIAARVNNSLRELTYKLNEDAVVEFIDMNDIDGVRIYQRSLTFVLIRASMELFNDIKLVAQYSINRGLFFECLCKKEITNKDVEKIKIKMDEIIASGEGFYKEKMSKEEAYELFDKYDMIPKKELLAYRERNYINIYSLGWLKNYFYGYMVPNVSYLKKYDLKKYNNGIVLLHPTAFTSNELPKYVENHKMAAIHQESETWGKILDVEYVYNLNQAISKKQYNDLIRVSEALHEKKIAEIADLISYSGSKIVLIAGPSSSGKTTFANRLSIQLRINNKKTIGISTDDYFVNRKDTPVGFDGKLDFETIEAVDVDQFNKDLSELIEGKTVELPEFDFIYGRRLYNGKKVKIKDNEIIIIEGIHALNEKLTRMINQKNKYKIYISDLTQLNIDEHNRIPTTDTRLIRRIIRDNKYRSHDAKKTIGQWPSVRYGEEKNIFPHQESADIMFNSALVTELSILKKYAVRNIRSAFSSLSITFVACLFAFIVLFNNIKLNEFDFDWRYIVIGHYVTRIIVMILLFLLYSTSYYYFITNQKRQHFVYSIGFLSAALIELIVILLMLLKTSFTMGNFFIDVESLSSLSVIIVFLFIFISIKDKKKDDIISADLIYKYVRLYIIPIISLVIVVSVVSLQILESYASRIGVHFIVHSIISLATLLMLFITLITRLKLYEEYWDENIIKIINGYVFIAFSELSVIVFGNFDDMTMFLSYIFKTIGFSIFYYYNYKFFIIDPKKVIQNKENQLMLYARNLEKIINKRTVESREANERFITELEYAKSIQQSLLPSRRLNIKGVNFLSDYFPCERLSGDFYDIYRIDEENIGMYVLDVSGHGISAALMTMYCNNYIKSSEKLIKRYRGLMPHRNFSHFYEEFNKMNFPDEMHMVLFYAALNTNTNVLTYCSGGMNCTPFIISAKGEITNLDKSKGFPICKLSDFFVPEYESAQIILSKGDRIIFYTDGLVDKDKNKIFTEDELKIFMRDNNGASLKDLNEELIDSIYPYADDLDDDVTYFIMEV